MLVSIAKIIISLDAGSGNGDPTELVKFCQNELGIWNIFSSDRRSRWLYCIQFYMADIRDAAFKILTTFPKPENAESVLQECLEAGMRLVCSPKFGECEAGAAIVMLCDIWKRKYELPDFDLKIERGFKIDGDLEFKISWMKEHSGTSLFENLIW